MVANMLASTYLRDAAFLYVMCLCVSPAMAGNDQYQFDVLGYVTTSDPAPEAKIVNPESYCQGFNYAVKMIMDNRDHWRALLGEPKMSHSDVVKWIYSLPWVDDATHRTAPRRLDQPSGIPQIGPDAIASADLYVFPGVICKATKTEILLDFTVSP